MRILQLIDSLEAGGAERMAVNYANALAKEVIYSGIVVTRKEGILSMQLDNEVSYFFINKTHTFDLISIFRLLKIVRENKIEFIHAHSTSFFTAFLIKLFYFRIKLIWHDHYGDSEFLNHRSSFILRICSFFFDGIIVVNHKLKIWAKNKLKFSNVIYLPNFTSLQTNKQSLTKLKGVENKRIICLANLRAQKNHFLLIELANKIKIDHSDWTFHLVGKDFEDDYSKKIKKLITNYNLHNNVYVYDSVSDIENVLNQSQIGILTSNSEGLPVALLEYGLAKLPVITTNVGEVSNVIVNNENGFIVPTNDIELFLEKLNKLINNTELGISFGKELHFLIQNKYSKSAVLKSYINWVSTTINKF
jgi:glycosyltransferase involved in cell wall biosynthesis